MEDEVADPKKNGGNEDNGVGAGTGTEALFGSFDGHGVSIKY